MTDRQVNVRVCGPAEAPVAAQLLHDFNTEFGTPSPGVAVLAPRIAELVARVDVEILLAEEPAVAVAVCTFRPSVWEAGPVAMLEELYVRPDLRGRGIGGVLLERALAGARGRGVATFEINVDSGDVDAQRCYRAHGFSDLEPDTGEQAWYFSRQL